MAMRRRLPLLALLVWLCGTWTAWGQRTGPDAPRYYMGREIAATMHYTGAPWLVRESRQREEDCVTLMRELRVTAGHAVCDMGCGNGFYTVELAELVGEQGKVYAVDIQEEMLELSQRRAKTAELENIVFLHGTTTDPRLPENSLDLVLMVDVYHEFSHPEEMLRAISKSLKATGQIALAEFRAEDPDVPIKPLHKMSKNQIFKEFRANGFRLVRQFDDLPWQHLMFFVREDSPVAATPTEIATPTAPGKTAPGETVPSKTAPAETVPAETGQKAPLPNLKVRVLDKDAQPVTGAAVLVYDRNNYFAGQPVDFEQRSELTDPEGWVDFGTMPQDYLCVQVQPREGEYFGSHSVIYRGEQGFVQTHPDRPAVTLETGETSLCVTFTVRMGVDLKFEVTDAGTGEPIFFPNIYYWDEQLKRWWTIALIDAGGQHDFITIVPELSGAQLRAAAVGYYPLNFDLDQRLEVGKEFTRKIQLKPAPEIRFTVFTPDGKPAKAAQLRCIHPEGLSNIFSSKEKSDERGTLTVPYPAQGDLAQFEITHDSGQVKMAVKELPAPIAIEENGERKEVIQCMVLLAKQ